MTTVTLNVKAVFMDWSKVILMLVVAWCCKTWRVNI